MVINTSLGFWVNTFLRFKLENFCPMSVGNQEYILPDLQRHRSQTVSYIKGAHRLAMQSGL